MAKDAFCLADPP